MSSATTFIRNNWHKILVVLFWVALILAVRQYLQANDLGFLQLAEQLQDTLTGEWYGPLLYIVVYLLRPLILFPASLLTILAGSIFGLVPGFLLALTAGTLSSLPPYAAGRWFSTDENPVEDDRFKRLRQFTSVMRRNPFQTVLTMRLLFLPYDVVSILAGSLRVPLAPFFLATALGNSVGAIPYVSAGASLEGDLASGDIGLNPAIIALAVTTLVASLGLSWFLRRRREVSNADEVITAEDMQIAETASD